MRLPGKDEPSGGSGPSGTGLPPFDAGARRHAWVDEHRPKFDLVEPPAGLSGMLWELRNTMRAFVWNYVHGMNRYQRYLDTADSGTTLELRQPSARWEPGRAPATMTGPQTFVFYGIERTLPDSRAWNHLPWGEQWLIQLHRFDDLCSVDADQRLQWHKALLSNWMATNRPGRGVGWSGRCLAARITNWIKWDLRSGGLSHEAAVRHLTVQVRYLCQFRRRHWQGGAQSEVAKALVFAGCFFADTHETRSWLKKGLRGLASLPPDQVSEMDAEDLDMLARVYPGVLPAGLTRRRAASHSLQFPSS